VKTPITLALLLSTSVSSANDLKGVYENNRGVLQFNNKKSVEAFDQFTHALGEMPFSGEVHYNLGTAFLANQEFPKAISEFNEALKNSPGDSRRERETRFRAAFNRAVALTAEKRIDEALNSYQAALNENPESVETKTNIELLTQSEGGKGKGDDKDQDQKKDQKGDPKDQKKDQKKDPKENEGKDQKKDQQKPQDQKNKPKPTPKPFKSDELNQQDVGKILDELKRQEEQIRARMQNDKVKDAPNDKDW
jgi:Ca-activated chloride channel family protein